MFYSARIFISSLNNLNKTSIELNKPLLNEEAAPKELIEEVVDILGKLPKPIMIEILTDISLAEMTCVSEIMGAFAEDAGGFDNNPKRISVKRRIFEI